MTDFLYETFNATTAPATVTDSTALGGSIDDSSVTTCSLIVTATAGSKALRRFNAVNMATDGDTITVKVATASAFSTFLVLR